MISFGVLASRIRTLHEAESSVRWSDDDILESVNDGLDELSEATGFYERFAPMVMRGGQSYYDLRGFLPQDAFKVNSVFNVDLQVFLGPLTIADMVRPRWETVTGSPQKYMIRGLFWLVVYPRPTADGGILRVYYSGHAPHFVNGDSVLYDLPDDHVPALEDYARFDMCAIDGEDDKSMKHWGSFLSRQASLQGFVSGRVSTARTGRIGHGASRRRFR